MTTGFLYHPLYLEHDTGPWHPERSDRLVAVMQYLERQPWFAQLSRIEARAVEMQWVEQIHEADYCRRAAEACRRELPYLDVPDVSVSRQSYDVALLAAGGALEIADRVMSGEIGNGFGLLRPPGHHAERNMALGFCLLNNIAILARYLQKRHGVEKVLILDWDVHHGNGTQHVFEGDASVFYVSLHQYPFYPGTGAASETGTGGGKGATLNCPMPAGSADDDYQRAFSESILPRIDAFRPDAVLISAGFDAHRNDPLAQINLSTDTYRWMSERMLEVADRHAGGRLIALLEGGYDLDTLARCVAAHVGVLAGAQR